MRFLNVFKDPKILTFDFVETKKEELASLCQKEDINLLYVYGSLAKNKMRKLSDVDIAVLKDKELSFDSYSKILGKLQEVFDREDIDLVDFTKIPPALKMRIIKSGQLVFCKDENMLKNLKYAITSLYLDTAYLRKSFSRYLRSAMGVA